MAIPAWPEELLGVPVVDPPRIDWADVQARTGFAFPTDYRQFAERYPALVIDDVLMVWHPAGPPGFNLLDSQGALDQAAAWGPPEESEEFDPDTGETRPWSPSGPERLFPWGRSATAPVFGFWVIGDDPSRLTVLLAGQFAQWRYRGSLTRLLPDLLTGRVTCPLLPGDWPDPETEREVQQVPG